MKKTYVLQQDTAVPEAEKRVLLVHYRQCLLLAMEEAGSLDPAAVQDAFGSPEASAE